MFAFNDFAGLWQTVRPATLFTVTVFLASVLGGGSAQAAGHLDGSYGVGGYLVEQVPGDASVTITAGGELRGVGVGPDDTCQVIAWGATGNRLAGWGGDATASFTCQGQFMFPGIVAQDDGRVVVASAGDWRVLELRRWSAAGTPDPSFGDNGVASIELPMVLWGHPKMQVAPDGAVVVALAGRPGSGCPGDFCDDEPFWLAVVRLAPEGVVTAARSYTSPNEPPPYTTLDPVILGVAARPDGSVTTVLAGSTACDPGKPCRFDADSITLANLATDGTVSSRVARWPQDYGTAAFAVKDDIVYVAKYEDNQGGTFLHQFDLEGNRQGDSIRLVSSDGDPRGLAIGPLGTVYVVTSQVDPMPGDQWMPQGPWLRRHILRAHRPDGQPDAAFATAVLDYGASLAVRGNLLLEAPARRLTIAATAPGRIGAARLSLDDGDHPGRLGIVPRVTSAQADSSVGQSDGESTTISQREATLEFAVDRTGGSEGHVSVVYQIDGNEAAAGAFEPASGQLEWSAGDAASKLVSLVLKAGAPVGEGARIELRLSEPAGGATMGAATHVVHVIAGGGNPGGGSPPPASGSPAGGGGSVSAALAFALALLAAAAIHLRRRRWLSRRSAR